ncbi:hypothetical protein Nmel_016640, partial [Mimus melanotis]
PGPLKQQNKAHKGGKHSGSSQRRAGGRVPVKVQPRRRLRDLNRVDRRHQALQLRRQRKEAVRPGGKRARPGRLLR